MYQGRKLGRGARTDTSGKIEYSASAGTGYAGFNVPTVSEFDFDDNTYYNMQGWPTGGFSFNSIWAPPLAAGSFSLKVTCTDATKFGAANFSKHTFPLRQSSLFLLSLDLKTSSHTSPVHE